jgi:predicted nucleic acid-binding protein
MYVIDSSIFLSGFFDYEPYHKESQKCLRYFKENPSVSVFLPEFVIPETGCVISRRIKKSKLGIEFAKSLRGFVNFKFIPVDRYIADLSRASALTSLVGFYTTSLSVPMMRWMIFE